LITATSLHLQTLLKTKIMTGLRNQLHLFTLKHFSTRKSWLHCAINTKTLWLSLHLFTFKHFSRRKSWLHCAINTKTLWLSVHLFTFKELFFQVYASVFICLNQIFRSASPLHGRYVCIIITLLLPRLLFIIFFLYHLLRFIITIFFSIAQTFLNCSILTIFFSISQTHLITKTSLHSQKPHLPLQFTTYLLFLILIWANLSDTKALSITQRYACLTFIFLWTTSCTWSSFMFHHLFCFSNFDVSSSSMFHHFLCSIIIIIFFICHILFLIINHFYKFF